MIKSGKVLVQSRNGRHRPDLGMYRNLSQTITESILCLIDDSREEMAHFKEVKLDPSSHHMHTYVRVCVFLKGMRHLMSYNVFVNLGQEKFSFIKTYKA